MFYAYADCLGNFRNVINNVTRMCEATEKEGKDMRKLNGGSSPFIFWNVLYLL